MEHTFTPKELAQGIHKFNHNHDAHGEFASGGGSDAMYKPLIDKLAKEGGFSVKPPRMTTPKTGYMVSAYPDHGKIVNDNSFGPKAIGNFMRTNEAVFEADKAAYLGVGITKVRSISI